MSPVGIALMAVAAATGDSTTAMLTRVTRIDLRASMRAPGHLDIKKIQCWHLRTSMARPALFQKLDPQGELDTVGHIDMTVVVDLVVNERRVEHARQSRNRVAPRSSAWLPWA